MGIPSVSIQRLKIGAHSLDLSKILPIHQKKISDYIIVQGVKAGSSSGPITIDATQDKQMKRLIRYYQHLGALPSVDRNKEEEQLSKKTAKAAARAMHLAHIPGTNGKILAGANIAEDTMSIVRNGLSAVVGPNNPVTSHLGYYAGVMWTFFSLKEWKGARKDMVRAEKIRDIEGGHRAKARLASGTLLSAASISYLAGRFLDTFGASQASAVSLAATDVLFGLGGLLAMGSFYLGWLRCLRFNQRLNEYLENPHFTEVQKFQGALRFLKDSLSVTPEEMKALKEKIGQENPQMSLLDQDALFKKELAYLTEAKVKYLKRRTSTKSLQLIVDNVDLLLEKLSHPTTQPEAIRAATLLIQKIQNENRTKMALYLLGFIAASVSLVGMFIVLFLTTSALPFLLYSISGAIYLFVDVYNTAGLFKRKKKETFILDSNLPLKTPVTA